MTAAAPTVIDFSAARTRVLGERRHDALARRGFLWIAAPGATPVLVRAASDALPRPAVATTRPAR